ncbi:MAG: hypothetical protein J3Q66DRAFT_382813 [Benniella sp.]|nr:MAG: hypothetical protein J3Q66DRAFT_382813 [Benniella sp.]
MNQSMLPSPPHRSLSTNTPTKVLYTQRQKHASTGTSHRSKASDRFSDIQERKAVPRHVSIPFTEDNGAQSTQSPSNILRGPKTEKSGITPSTCVSPVGTQFSEQHERGVVMGSQGPKRLTLEQFRLCIELCCEHMNSRGAMLCDTDIIEGRDSAVLFDPEAIVAMMLSSPSPMDPGPSTLSLHRPDFLASPAACMASSDRHPLVSEAPVGKIPRIKKKLSQTFQIHKPHRSTLPFPPPVSPKAEASCVPKSILNTLSVDNLLDLLIVIISKTPADICISYTEEHVQKGFTFREKSPSTISLILKAVNAWIRLSAASKSRSLYHTNEQSYSTWQWGHPDQRTLPTEENILEARMKAIQRLTDMAPTHVQQPPSTIAMTVTSLRTVPSFGASDHQIMAGRGDVRSATATSEDSLLESETRFSAASSHSTTNSMSPDFSEGSIPSLSLPPWRKKATAPHRPGESALTSNTTVGFKGSEQTKLPSRPTQRGRRKSQHQFALSKIFEEKTSTSTGISKTRVPLAVSAVIRLPDVITSAYKEVQATNLLESEGEKSPSFFPASVPSSLLSNSVTSSPGPISEVSEEDEPDRQNRHKSSTWKRHCEVQVKQILESASASMVQNPERNQGTVAVPHVLRNPIAQPTIPVTSTWTSAAQGPTPSGKEPKRRPAPINLETTSSFKTSLGPDQMILTPKLPQSTPSLGTRLADASEQGEKSTSNLDCHWAKKGRRIGGKPRLILKQQLNHSMMTTASRGLGNISISAVASPVNDELISPGVMLPPPLIPQGASFSPPLAPSSSLLGSSHPSFFEFGKTTTVDQIRITPRITRKHSTASRNAIYGLSSRLSPPPQPLEVFPVGSQQSITSVAAMLCNSLDKARKSAVTHERSASVPASPSYPVDRATNSSSATQFLDGNASLLWSPDTNLTSLWPPPSPRVVAPPSSPLMSPLLSALSSAIIDSISSGGHEWKHHGYWGEEYLSPVSSPTAPLSPVLSPRRKRFHEKLFRKWNKNKSSTSSRENAFPSSNSASLPSSALTSPSVSAFSPSFTTVMRQGIQGVCSSASDSCLNIGRKNQKRAALGLYYDDLNETGSVTPRDSGLSISTIILPSTSHSADLGQHPNQHQHSQMQSRGSSQSLNSSHNPCHSCSLNNQFPLSSPPSTASLGSDFNAFKSRPKPIASSAERLLTTSSDRFWCNILTSSMPFELTPPPKPASASRLGRSTSSQPQPSNFSLPSPPATTSALGGSDAATTMESLLYEKQSRLKIRKEEGSMGGGRSRHERESSKSCMKGQEELRQQHDARHTELKRELQQSQNQLVSRLKDQLQEQFQVQFQGQRREYGRIALQSQAQSQTELRALQDQLAEMKEILSAALNRGLEEELRK